MNFASWLKRWMPACAGMTMLLVSVLVFASSPFSIHKIDIQGLARVSDQTLLSYLPVKVGETLTEAKSEDVIKALYATQFFSHVALLQDGNTLIIKVEERPTISSINIVGNKEIPKDKLDEALKKMGFAEGQIFEKAILEQVKQALSEQYYAMGRYSARVTAEVVTEPRRRVAITLKVSEGMAVRVAKVSVLGASVFSESTLRAQLAVAPTNMLSLFNSKDEYAKEKLDKSVEALQNYYLDRGYLDMRVDSTQVTLTPDKKLAYIVFHIKEGSLYHVNDIDFTGTPVLSESTLLDAVFVKKGELFSRQKVLDSTKVITNQLGDLGYALAKVNVKPRVDEAQHLVSLNFDIEPGNVYYVRHIRFTGNTATSNIALRNVLTQFEGARYSTTQIEQSTRNLRQLPYLKAPDMEVTPTPVSGSADQVDLEVKVTEQSSANFQFGVGYSQAFGALISTGITQNNFLGTGKTVGANISLNQFQQSYSLSYVNPFFTYDGVSHSMSVAYTNTNPGAVIGATNTGYAVSAVSFSEGFGFPLTNYQQFNLGYTLQAMELLMGGSASTQLTSFKQAYGTQFYQAILNTGWSYSTLDRFQLPTRGLNQSFGVSVSAPIASSGLEYYTLMYRNRFYQPVVDGLILNTNFVAAYGNGYGIYPSLPFLQNYYAGGIGTLGQNRAYLPNSLGPISSNGQAMGGNLLTSASVGFIIPTFLDRYNVRTSLFLDAGNVFNTQTNIYQPTYNPSFDQLRYSYGFQVEWWTPIGMPLVFSLARPLNAQPGDQTMLFQFNIGAAV